MQPKSLRVVHNINQVWYSGVDVSDGMDRGSSLIFLILIIQSHLVVRNLFVRENLLFRNQGLRAQRPHTKSLAIMKYIVKDTV